MECLSTRISTITNKFRTNPTKVLNDAGIRFFASGTRGKAFELIWKKIESDIYFYNMVMY